MKFYNVSHRLKPRRGFSIFLVCFVIALLSWTTLKLSKTYTIKLEYKISYYNVPHEIEIDRKSDSIFKLIIQDRGYNILLNNHLYKNKTIHIDASKLIDEHENNVIYPIKIIEDALKNQKSISSIEQIDLQSIRLSYFKKSQKKVPIYSLMSWNTQKQYFVSDSIRIIPDSAWVYGKKEDLAKISFVTTKSSTITELKSPYFGLFDLSARSTGNTDIHIEPTSTFIYVPIERYTESTVQCKIVDKYNEEFDLKTFPNSVNITFYVAVSKFKNIADSNFAVTLDFTQNVGENRAPVIITKMPENIKVVKVVPDMVEYLKVRK
jgi:hypothetical protein